MRASFHFLRFGVLAVVALVLLCVGGVFAFIPGERQATATPAIISGEETALTLAAIGGRARAASLAKEIGARGWDRIKARYGDATAAFVRVQLEDLGHTTGG